jgi:hypothetical protein
MAFLLRPETSFPDCSNTIEHWHSSFGCLYKLCLGKQRWDLAGIEQNATALGENRTAKLPLFCCSAPLRGSRCGELQQRQWRTGIRNTGTLRHWFHKQELAFRPCILTLLWLQGDFGLTLFQDGFVASIFMVGLSIGAPSFAQLTKHFNGQRLIGVGLALFCCGATLCSMVRRGLGWGRGEGETVGDKVFEAVALVNLKLFSSIYCYYSTNVYLMRSAPAPAVHLRSGPQLLALLAGTVHCWAGQWPLHHISWATGG